MERKLKIPVGRKKPIDGTLRGSLRKPLVIFVHGLTGDPHEHQFYNGVRAVEKSGLSSFTYALYSSLPLRKATLKTHAEDLDQIIKYFRKKGVKKIYVVGHSYGGATILLSKDKNYDRAVLWDASYGGWNKVLKRNSKSGEYEIEWGTTYVIGKEMVKERKTIKWNSLGKGEKAPILLIAANDGALVKGNKHYLKNIPHHKKKLIIIPGANHTFTTGDSAKRLHQETVKWFKK